jgi:hypothetical protein
MRKEPNPQRPWAMVIILLALVLRDYRLGDFTLWRVRDDVRSKAYFVIALRPPHAIG